MRFHAIVVNAREGHESLFFFVFFFFLIKRSEASPGQRAVMNFLVGLLPGEISLYLSAR